MIPTYNRTKYLEKTLRSILEQDPGENEMQIEVIDNCSTALIAKSQRCYLIVGYGKQVG